MSHANFMDKLLDGLEVEWKPLAEVARIKHGKDWKKLGFGKIPVYGSGGIMGYVDTLTEPHFADDKPFDAIVAEIEGNSL